MSGQLRSYMRKIGAKGGRAGKGTETRRKVAQKAAISRWRREHPKPPKIIPK